MNKESTEFHFTQYIK
jgi:hypothetical protein